MKYIFGLYDSDGQVVAVGGVHDIAKCMNTSIESVWRLERKGSVRRGKLKGYKVEKILIDDEEDEQ